jgi:hypothetical protein
MTIRGKGISLIRRGKKKTSEAVASEVLVFMQAKMQPPRSPIDNPIFTPLRKVAATLLRFLSIDDSDLLIGSQVFLCVDCNQPHKPCEKNGADPL